MPERLAFLFPGQGQLPDRVVSAPAVEALYVRTEEEGLPIRAWVEAHDVERLSRTDAAQPAVFLDALARCALFEKRGVHPDVVAGHSLGEYPALVTARVLTPETALELVLRRGRLMASVPGGMTAVLKLDHTKVAEVCGAVGRGVSVANHNGREQFVVSGPLDALAEVEEEVARLGGRAIRLAVSGPFHSPAMRPAQEALSPHVTHASFSPPRCVFVSSVTGRPESQPTALRELLARQMTAPVRWTDVLASLAELPVERAIEIGGGTVLTQIGRRSGLGIRFSTFEEVYDE